MAIVEKNAARLRRAGRSRHKIRRLGVSRLSVYRSSNHIYAQVFTSMGDQVLVSASTLDKELQCNDHRGNAKAAELVGTLLAKRCQEKGISRVAFDRSGYRYHGCVKALAEAVRKGGIEF